jgi:hypothetical protein
MMTCMKLSRLDCQDAASMGRRGRKGSSLSCDIATCGRFVPLSQSFCESPYDCVLLEVRE